jgi:hypothetical protein
MKWLFLIFSLVTTHTLNKNLKNSRWVVGHPPKSKGWPWPPPKPIRGGRPPPKVHRRWLATPHCSGGGHTTPGILCGWPTIHCQGFVFSFFIFFWKTNWQKIKNKVFFLLLLEIVVNFHWNNYFFHFLNESLFLS